MRAGKKKEKNAGRNRPTQASKNAIGTCTWGGEKETRGRGEGRDEKKGSSHWKKKMQKNDSGNSRGLKDEWKKRTCCVKDPAG